MKPSEDRKQIITKAALDLELLEAEAAIIAVKIKMKSVRINQLKAEKKEWERRGL